MSNFNGIIVIFHGFGIMIQLYLIQFDTIVTHTTHLYYEINQHCSQYYFAFL